MKKIININSNWVFSKEELSPTDDLIVGKKVRLPYVLNFNDNKVFLKKTFKVDQLYKKMFLEIKECPGTAEVFINDVLAGKHYGSYTCFRYNITGLIKNNQDNTITIIVKNENNEKYGLIGDINLILTDKMHFELLDYGSCGIYITPYLKEKNADIEIKALISGKIANSSSEYSIFDHNNKKVCNVYKPASTQDFVLTIYNAKLWNGYQQPYLYTLRARIFSHDNDEIYDEKEIKFGIRQLKLENDKDFLLNTKNYKLNLVTLNHSINDFSNNVSDFFNTELTKTREIGATSIKYLNNYYSDSFYDLCDKEGLLVSYDISFLPLKTKKRELRKNLKNYLIELIKQNYNHPSLCFWNLEHNTISDLDISKIFFYRKLFNLIRKYDKKRIIVNSSEKAFSNAGCIYDEIKNDTLQKGLISLDNTKNDLFYYYKLIWTDHKFVYICGSRVQYTKLPSTHLKIYSSCKKISIFKNGKHLTSLSADDKIYELPIDLKIGENRITVNSEINCGDTIIVNRVAITQ